MTFNIAAIGDIHTRFDETDIALFNDSDYDLILIVGDLPGRSHRQTLSVARVLSKLNIPALFVPGNHDCTSIKHLLGEITGDPFLKQSSSESQMKRVSDLTKALGTVRYLAYEKVNLHEYTGKNIDIELIAGRPHSMGGPGLSFKKYLADAFNVDNVEQSADKISSLAEKNKNYLILAHNGPYGLGAKKDDIFGADFKPEAGDFGDQDLQFAIEQMKAKENRILAVVAGHMHHSLKGGGTRKWLLETDGTFYINSAFVPRIRKREGIEIRHHVRIEIDSKHSLQVEQIFWDQNGKPV